MYRIYQLFIVCYLLLISTWLHADTTQAAKMLSKQLSNMNALQASFKQQIKDDQGQLLQSASGKVNVKRPRRFHWRTSEPYEHLVVTDGNMLWLYDIDLEQASKQTFSDDLDKAPALLLSGEVEQISKQFHVRIIKQTNNSAASAESTNASDRSASGLDNTDTQVTYELLPIEEKGLFSRLTISFRAGKIEAMSLVDSFEQQTYIAFSDVKINPVIDDSLFTFVAPDGIDIISND